MPVFQSAEPWHTIFTSSCIISLCDSATPHSHSRKELILSSMKESCFSGLIVLLIFSYYPAWAPGLSLVWYSPILLIKSICIFILSVVYFYSERLPCRSSEEETFSQNKTLEWRDCVCDLLQILILWMWPV